MKFFYRFLKSASLHPLLFATFPTLALWAYNFDRMQPIEVVFPLILSIFSSLFLFLLFRQILRNWLKASLLTSLMVLLFFSYGHVFDLIIGMRAIIISIFSRPQPSAPIKN
jgi:hypothetical protein